MTKLNKIHNYFSNEKNIWKISIILGVFITFLVTFSTKAYSQNIQNNIATEMIRFHVLANSDLKVDQDLKIKVKNGIIELLRKELSESKSKSETIEMLSNNIDRIISTSENIISQNGFNYNVTAKITKSQFPTKNYANVTLPAGIYDCLKIEIGEAKGQNWWCVMFPPLCFVDVTYEKIPMEDKKLLNNILDEDEYNLITDTDKNIDIKIKFKIVEWWNEKKSKNIDFK